MWKTIAQQFAKPDGFKGTCATKLMNMMNHQMYHDVIKLIKQDEQCVLDIGFGNGYVMKRLMDQGHIVYGLEVSDSMLHQVKMKYKKAMNHTMFLEKGSIEQLPYEKEFFDVIYSINTLYFWESLDIGLKELYRCLKDDGSAILSFYDRSFLNMMPLSSYGFKVYEKKHVMQAVNRNGFVISKVLGHRYGTSITLYMNKK